jgi:hypothetical protein
VDLSFHCQAVKKQMLEAKKHANQLWIENSKLKSVLMQLLENKSQLPSLLPLGALK